MMTSTPATTTSNDDDSDGSFPYAPASYFSLDQLKTKGPRPCVDWGIPTDATKQLYESDDGIFCVGSWYCTEGGWPSPNPKASTEVFYVLDGYGSLDDEDGMRHYFGPGDCVIIPKGHTGRWDVNQAIHKIWAVNDHRNIEERNTPIRVQVDHYNGWAPQHLTPNRNGYDPLYGPTTNNNNNNNAGTTTTSSKVFYDVGPTQVGIWSSCKTPCNFVVTNGKRAWIYILEGVVIISNGITGSARRCVPGDTIVVPAGWCGHVDVIEGPVKKLFTVVAES